VALAVGLNVGGLRDRLPGRPFAGPTIESLAVLPLENLSGDPEQEYFVDGMHEALTAELSKIGALKVISRTSAMRYKGLTKPLPQIARELGVNGLIQGSVAREGDQVRVSVQLIHAPTDEYLWSASYQRELRSVLALQSEVAQAIAEQIEVTLTPEEAGSLATTELVDPAAYEEYLRGLYQYNKNNAQSWQAAVRSFQQSVERDSSYAPAHAMLSLSYTLQGYYGSLTPPAVLYSRALAAAERALALDDSLAEAHASLAMIRVSYDWDWAAADLASQEALRLNPNSTMALFSRAFFLSWMGRHEEAIAVAKRNVELDPVAPHVNSDLGMFYMFARRYDEAIGQLNKVLALEPDHIHAHGVLWQSYALKGMYGEAEREEKKMKEIGGREEVGWSDAWLLALAGRSTEARKVYEQIAEEYADPGGSYFGAMVLCQLGEKDRAFALLEQAYQGRSSFMSVLKVDPRMDPLRDDPRFEDLLRRMNFPE
jgi:TolB-like protein/Tfp pilus assembly protein PilF